MRGSVVVNQLDFTRHFVVLKLNSQPHVLIPSRCHVE